MKNILLITLFLVITIHAFKVPNALNEFTAENLQSFVDSISSFKTFHHTTNNRWNQSKAEEIIKTAMQCNGIPGLGVAVILEGKVVLLKGYGYRDVKKLKPFTPQTLFWTGSTAKAITSTLIGMLVDEGKLNWDEPIVNYLKDFQLIDKFATSRMTLVDALTHRSGLPRHDISWIFNSKKERSELVHSLRVLQPNKDFRYEFEYNNLMYATAGYIAGLRYNTSFENLLQSKILNTLMPNTKLHYNKTLRLHDNISLGYYCNDPTNPNPPCKRGVVEVPNLEKDQHDIMECGNVILPAGGIISTLEDYTKWLLMNMNGGEFNGKRYISQSNLKKIFTPTQTMHEIQMDLPQPKYPGIMYYGYGLAWMFIRYRGYNMISHGGNLFGYSTMVSFLPEEKSGVILFSNNVGSTNLLYQLTFALSDMLLNLPPWITKDMLCPTPSLNSKKKTPSMKGTTRIDDSILGDYSNLAYGKVVIFKRGNELAFSLAGWEGTLTKIEGDTYLGYFVQSWGEFQTYCTFVRSGSKVVGVTMILEPSVDPILFNKL